MVSMVGPELDVLAIELRLEGKKINNNKKDENCIFNIFFSGKAAVFLDKPPVEDARMLLQEDMLLLMLLLLPLTVVMLLLPTMFPFILVRMPWEDMLLMRLVLTLL